MCQSSSAILRVKRVENRQTNDRVRIVVNRLWRCALHSRESDIDEWAKYLAQLIEGVSRN